MMVLDTNVVSDLMSARPNAAVAGWLRSKASDMVFVTTITEAELRFGAALLPAGSRRDLLEESIGKVLESVFGEQFLHFDRFAARHYALIAAERRRLGRPIAMPDAMIAAICLANGMSLATRNVKDFTDTGVVIINPFDAA